MELLRKIFAAFAPKGKIRLTVVIEQDKATGLFMAHFEQFPDTYAYASNTKEVVENLCKTLICVLDAEAQHHTVMCKKPSPESVVRHEYVDLQLA